MTPVRKLFWFYRLAILFILLLLVCGGVFMWLVLTDNPNHTWDTPLMVTTPIVAFLAVFFHYRADKLHRQIWPTDPYCP